LLQKWYKSAQQVWRGKGVKYNVQLGYFFFFFLIYFSCQALENTFLGAVLVYKQNQNQTDDNKWCRSFKADTISSACYYGNNIQLQQYLTGLGNETRTKAKLHNLRYKIKITFS